MAEVMSSSENEIEISGSETGESKTFQERLSEIPAYTMTLSQLQWMYTTVKERNEVLKNAFDTGEQYVSSFATVAKPVVWAATTSAIKVAKPVVGEVEDPAAAIDSAASEVLAKVQEKLPFVKQTPGEIAEAAKTSAQETANYYLQKVQTSSLGQQATKQLDNAVSFSELMVEICFPTDASNPEDIREIEKAEEDEDKGILLRAGNLKDKACRRGTRKLMSYRRVQATVDSVQYAQNQMAEVTEKLRQGTNYVAEKSAEVKTVVINNYPQVKSAVEGKVAEGAELLKKNWDHVYQTTMYIPRKALQVSGEVYVSAQEIVFAYTKAHSVTEMPHAVAEMAESYYKNLKEEAPTVDEMKEKAVAFVYVPAQVVAAYLRTTRAVQWIVPKAIETDTIAVMETVVEYSEA